MNDNIKELNLAILGLGYVGLPLALAFAKKRKVIGFDTNNLRIKELIKGKDKNLEFTKDGIANIRDRVLDALEHEMIHMRQYRSRSFVRQRDYKTKDKEPDVKRAKEYLGNDDEIEAFAKNISAELLRKRDKQTAIDLLRKVTQTAGLKDELGYLLSPNLLGYLAVWGFNTKHPVIKKLLKKVYNNIENS